MVLVDALARYACISSQVAMVRLPLLRCGVPASTAGARTP